MVRDEGLGIAETARRLSISPKTIANWVKLVQEGQDFARQRSVSDVDAENSRLCKENARLRIQCEILKKRRRTLPRSRCEIGRCLQFATQLSAPARMPVIARFHKRLLFLA
jgi:transposase-like protein